MRVNVKSVFLGCKYALAQMLRQEPHSSGDRGWIVNISSIMGMIVGPENRKHHIHIEGRGLDVGKRANRRQLRIARPKALLAS